MNETRLAGHSLIPIDKCSLVQCLCLQSLSGRPALVCVSDPREAPLTTEGGHEVRHRALVSFHRSANNPANCNDTIPRKHQEVVRRENCQALDSIPSSFQPFGLNWNDLKSTNHFWYMVVASHNYSDHIRQFLGGHILPLCVYDDFKISNLVVVMQQYLSTNTQ